MLDRKINKISAKAIKKGEIICMTTYCVVKEILNNDTIIVQDITNKINEVSISGKDLLESCTSADQFSETVKFTKTQLAELLVHLYNKPFSVSFTKTDGTDRVIRGRLIKPEPLLGRSRVEDLDLPETETNRSRLVDHRTIHWIVVDGVKYVNK